MSETTEKKPGGCTPLIWVLAAFVIVILLGSAIGPMSPSIRNAPQSGAVQMARSIAFAMFQYSNDHEGKYPDGKSSTEVFQKLIPTYISDPAMLYVPYKGKTKALPGQPLKPENVCWDVTGGIDNTSGDRVPVVFLTGFKVTYAPGTRAVPLIKPFPPYAEKPTFWFALSTPYFSSGGIAVARRDNSAQWLKFEIDAVGNGSIPYFIPLDSPPDGRTYRQLTPDGVLP